ncbi:MAG: hypothetical protein U0M96_08295 [Eggerthellaceae bacterium]
MNIGTFVVAAILVVIVAAIIVSMVRTHRAGGHVGCDSCGGCSCSTSQPASDGAHMGGCGCANMDAMVDRMNEDLKGK